MYHTELITRSIIKWAYKYVPSSLKGINITSENIEKYSRKEANATERSEYFSLAGTVFSVGGVVLCFIFVPLLIIHLALFKSSILMSFYFFVFIFPLTLGNFFMIKEMGSKKGKLQTFTKVPLVISLISSLLVSLSVEGLFFMAINVW